MIVIVGVGALGSHVALFGRNWDKPLRLVDFDRVEMKNTQAQFHTKMGLGRNKTQALLQSFQGLWGLKVEANTNRLTPDNAKAILGGASLVLDCTDNAEARRTIQGFVRQNGLPCLHGALSADGTFGRIVWDEHFVLDEEGKLGEATCEDGRTLPFFALAAAQMALVTQTFLEKGTKQSYQISPTGFLRLT